MMASTHNKGRGFAGMDAQRQHEIASKGGRSVPAEKRSFSRDHKLAAEAGHKGGQHSHRQKMDAVMEPSGYQGGRTLYGDY